MLLHFNSMQYCSNLQKKIYLSTVTLSFKKVYKQILASIGRNVFFGAALTCHATIALSSVFMQCKVVTSWILAIFHIWRVRCVRSLSSKRKVSASGHWRGIHNGCLWSNRLYKSNAIYYTLVQFFDRASDYE